MSLGLKFYIGIIARTNLDGELLSSLLSIRPDLEVAFVTSSFEAAPSLLIACEPDVVVLDPAITQGSIRSVVDILDELPTKHLVVLDDRPRDANLSESLKSSSTSYLTRNVTSKALTESIGRLAREGQREFDASVKSRLHWEPAGTAIRIEAEQGSLASLTKRELAAFRLISVGLTTKEVAAHMGVVASTVDNHKTRLARKLGIRKAQQFTLRAIQEGLIVADSCDIDSSHACSFSSDS